MNISIYHAAFESGNHVFDVDKCILKLRLLLLHQIVP